MSQRTSSTSSLLSANHLGQSKLISVLPRFSFIYPISPLHNVNPKKTYPPYLITTADRKRPFPFPSVLTFIINRPVLPETKS
jgi:hypothetical protein